MRIVWIKVGGLWPVNTGGRRRSFEILSELARRHHVTLITTHGPHEDPGPLRSALPHCAAIHSVPFAIPKARSLRFLVSLVCSWFTSVPVDVWKCRNHGLRSTLLAVLAADSPDACVADFLAAVPNLPDDLRTPVLLFEHNVEHSIWRRLRDRETHPLRRALLEIEWRKMRSYEARACERAQHTIAVSEADRAMLSSIAPGASIGAVPTGVDTAFFAPRGVPERPASLVFTGAMDWYPNEEAITRFMAQTLPTVRSALPEITLTVVGRNPSRALRDAAERAGVRVTGTVEDVRPYIAEASLYIVPLRIGGGTRLKIFEALAMGKAVLSTSIGAEGLPLSPGTHFVQADEPAEFARELLALLGDPARRRSLGEAGRLLVEQKFSWPQITRSFEAQLTEVSRHAN